MEQSKLRELLNEVANGQTDVEQAMLLLKSEPFADLGYAKVDTHRGVRCGASEVIYGEGKTAEQIVGIVKSMREHGQEAILITRLGADAAAQVGKAFPLDYDVVSRLGFVGGLSESAGGRKDSGRGKIVVAAAGTSDIPVAEEAARTAEFYGNKVVRLSDVGVAGLHRLLAYSEQIMTARVIVAVAGMEGALASVIGGMADCPVIAVPTSVGYGASFGGVSALLGMLNSCAAGVSVVNIDNGFGAGYLASRINQMGEKPGGKQ